MKQRKTYNVNGEGDDDEDVAVIKNEKSYEKTDPTQNPPMEKFIEARETDTVELKRNLTLVNGIAIIVGSIIGSGIFLTPAGVYENAQSTWGAIVVWALAGVFSMIGAICFAELGTCITRSGGDYAYILEAFGPFPAFLTLWVTIMIIRPVTAAVVALTFAEYAIRPFFLDSDTPAFAPQLLATVCLCLLTAVNCSSVKLSMKIQDLFTAGKLIALVTIIVTGFVYLFLGMAGNEGPAETLKENSFVAPFDFKGEEFDYPKLSLSVYNGLFAYAGWNYLNFVTAELQNPYQNLPRAIWIGLPLVTVIYVLANIAYFIVLSPTEMIRYKNSVAVAFGSKTFGSVQWIIPIFVALSTFGGVNGTLFSSARLFFAGAEDGQLPKVLAFIHVRNFTPVPALLFQCLISVLYLLTGKIGPLINYVSFVLWASTGFAVASLIRLRYSKPNLPRPIRVHISLPVIYIFCTIFIVGCSIYAEPVDTGIGCLLTLTGVPVYFLSLWMKKQSRRDDGDTCWGRFVTGLQKLLNVIPQEKSEVLL